MSVVFVFLPILFLLHLLPSGEARGVALCVPLDACEEDWWKSLQIIIWVWTGLWGGGLCIVFIGSCICQVKEDQMWKMVTMVCCCTCPFCLPFYLCHLCVKQCSYLPDQQGDLEQGKDGYFENYWWIQGCSTRAEKIPFTGILSCCLSYFSLSIVFMM